MTLEHNSKNKIVMGVIALLFLVAGIFVYKLPNKEKEVPSNINNTINASAWLTSTDSDEGITFKYPDDFGTTYTHPVDWPPVAQVMEGTFACTEAGQVAARAGRTMKKTIGGREYCVTEETEGAAGSIYTQYAYQTAVGGKLVFFTFTTRAVQCDNYDDPEKTACKNERTAFNIDTLIDQIIQTIELK